MDVQSASKQFYAALNSMLNGNADPLADIWSHSASVATMHPIGGRQVGWDSVWESWARVAQISSERQVELGERILEIAGNVAYELGVGKGHAKLGGERVVMEHRATNIYRREAGGWKIVHHHTDVSNAMLGVVGRLEAQAKL